MGILASIADGEPVQRAEVPLYRVLEHVSCPNCTGGLLPKDVSRLLLVSIEGKISASPKDRIAALKLQAELGIGPDKELSAESIREKLRAQLQVLESKLPLELLKDVVPALRKVWTEK